MVARPEVVAGCNTFVVVVEAGIVVAVVVAGGVVDSSSSIVGVDTEDPLAVVRRLLLVASFSDSLKNSRERKRGEKVR